MPASDETQVAVDLSSYRNPPWHDKGRSFVVRALWVWVNAAVLINPFNPSSRLKEIALRAFGARIGKNAILKPGINVKQPWKLEMGDNCWVGERVWIDSYSYIKMGNNVCISQDAYICTGNHDWSDSAFGLIEQPVVIEDGVWVGARATVLPGATLRSHAVISAGAVISKDTVSYTIYAGNPAQPAKTRKIVDSAKRPPYSAPERP